MPKDDELISWGWPTKQSTYLMNLWLKYKITNIEFEKFWAKQDGKCVCGKAFAHPLRREPLRLGYQPQVDHKHRKDEAGNDLPCETADVRGLLCQRCNRILGILRDNADILNGLLRHLRNYGELEDNE